jgi:hypothetical protein
MEAGRQRQSGGSHKKIFEILLNALVRSQRKDSIFLKNVLDYINCLQQTTKYAYPYYEIQDCLIFS